MAAAGRALLVPAADVTAKNMRAADWARGRRAVEVSSAPRLLVAASDADRLTPEEARRLWRRAPDDAPAGGLCAWLDRVFPREGAEVGERRSVVMAEWRARLLPVLEKAASLAGRLPDPMVLFLALVLAVLAADALRPALVRALAGRLAFVAAFGAIAPHALLWRKTELFARLREGVNPLAHPAEHRLEGLDAAISAREDAVRKAQVWLKASRAQLDALRKELAKDPAAATPDAVLVPNRKAAAMIAAGALGAGYDPVAARRVEAARKKESVLRSREEWRAKGEETVGDAVQTTESLKRLGDHAATVYTKRTRELKMRSAAGQGFGPAQFGALRKTLAAVASEVPGRGSRDSDASAGQLSTASTAGARRRRGLFGRRKTRADSERAQSEAG